MKAISLFSGVGGFELGFDRAGIGTVLQVENDPHALSVLARHWPDTERVNDVRKVGLRDGILAGNRSGANDSGSRSELPGCVVCQVDETALEGRGGDLARAKRCGDSQSERFEAGESAVDLVYGGFPCQDVSVAGQRRGLAGERSGLWREFHRIVRELRPRWVVVENVPGLLSSNGGADFAIILNALGELGYCVGWAVLDAQHFGVPQRRRRVFVVAGPGAASVRAVLSVCESCGGDPPPGRTPEQEAAGTLRSGTRGSDDTDRATFIPVGVDGGDTGYSLRAHPSRSGDKGDGSNSVGAITVAATLRSQESRDGINMPGRGGEDDANLIHVPDIVGALNDGAHHEGGLNGQDAYSGRVFSSATGVRRLTPRECERLMGWPDDWTRWRADGREIADSHRYRMIGNGVVAPVAEWLGRQLVVVDRELQRNTGN